MVAWRGGLARLPKEAGGGGAAASARPRPAAGAQTLDPTEHTPEDRAGPHQALPHDIRRLGSLRRCDFCP
jgi:hypothetical protein